MDFIPHPLASDLASVLFVGAHPDYWQIGAR